MTQRAGRSTRHHLATTIPGPMLREVTYRYLFGGRIWRLRPSVVIYQPDVVAQTRFANCGNKD
jgi:hypothetical protein